MILVTGAAGRLGRRVAQLLLDRGYEVLGTDKVLADDVPTEVVQADLLDVDTVERLLEGAEGVIHMGAIPGPLSADSREIFENNVQSTFNVMTKAAEKACGGWYSHQVPSGWGGPTMGQPLCPAIYPSTRNTR